MQTKTNTKLYTEPPISHLFSLGVSAVLCGAVCVLFSRAAVRCFCSSVRERNIYQHHDAGGKKTSSNSSSERPVLVFFLHCSKHLLAFFLITQATKRAFRRLTRRKNSARNSPIVFRIPFWSQSIQVCDANCSFHCKTADTVIKSTPENRNCRTKSFADFRMPFDGICHSEIPIRT